MADFNRRRPLDSTPQASRLLQSSLRPSGFLNMLNPMSGRNYQGYMQANQSVLEEDENEQENELDDTSPFRSNRDRSSTLGESSRMATFSPGRSDVSNTHTKDDSSDDEVPQSMMIETSPHARRLSNARQSKGKATRHRPRTSNVGPILPITSDDLNLPPRPSEVDTPTTEQAQSQASQKRNIGLDAYERALWNWVNVYDLDVFLQDVYRYYEGNGIVSIALARGLHLLTIGFTIFFSTYLLNCIDYSRIKPEGITRLNDVVYDSCISRLSSGTILFFIIFTAYYTAQIVSYVFEVMRLVDMYRFYTHLLRIPDADIQTISWSDVVRRIEAIREDNPITALSSASQGNPSSSITAKLDAHDIANRIMRQENYLIALFNKDLLDLRIPSPAIVKQFINTDDRHVETLSTALEHNLRICLIKFLFDPRGRVREAFLKERNRTALIEELRRRFIFMGILNAVLAPFIVIYLMMYSFFRYFEEYHKNPSSLGGRSYTLFARWKFREFNELPHIFSRRLHESYPTVSMYIGQFPNDKLALIMRFISFVAGSFAAVLLLASVLDPEIFTHFEITPHRTVLFYIGVFGSILAVTRGMIPEDNKIFDPELLMMEVIHYTHYMPETWKGQLHSQKVHKEFGKLFDMKVMIFIREVLSVVITPFVLCFSLPNSAPAIVDFFREFTVHVDSLGYVCSFAVFDFKRHGNVNFGAPNRVKEKYMSKEGKMEKSFLNFKAANPDWQPTDPSGSLYLSRMAEVSPAYGVGRWRPSDPHGHVRGLSREQRLADRAQDYDRALKQSQNAALRRRQGPSGRVSGATTGLGQLPTVASSAADSTTTVTNFVPQTTDAASGGLMESNINPFPSELDQESRLRQDMSSSPSGPTITYSDELSREGEVRSELGESYVDGKVSRGRPSVGPSNSQREEGGVVPDGGVMDMLAQIYGTRAPRMI